MKYLSTYESFGLLLEVNKSKEGIKKELDKVDDIIKDIDIKDINVQVDFIDKLIGSEFDLDKIDTEGINKEDEEVNESHNSSELFTEVIENFERSHFYEGLIKRFGLDKVVKAFKIIKDIVKLPWTLLKKFIFWICRNLFGASFETSNKASFIGAVCVCVIGLIISSMHFPEVTIIGAGFYGLTKLFFLISKIWGSIKHAYEELKKFVAEGASKGKEAIYTIFDFIDSLEMFYKDFYKKKISSDISHKLDEWVDTIKEDNKIFNRFVFLRKFFIKTVEKFKNLTKLDPQHQSVVKRDLERSINDMLDFFKPYEKIYPIIVELFKSFTPQVPNLSKVLV